jgi:(2R)-3-sulfolactate dehydrogenase (NADP+)
MARPNLAEIEGAARRALLACGADTGPAASVARSVRRAEADGLRLVGLGYLPTYLSHLKSGKVDGRAIPTIEQPRPGAVLVDAAHGFAHPAFDAGLPRLIAASRCNGVASLAIRRSYSMGVLGHPLEDVAAAGLVGLAFTNSPPNIAPVGGRKPLFGTNPMACAVPRNNAPPLVIDQASSVVTKVALVAAAKAGTVIPPTWALDDTGEPTTDPKKALSGSMQGFGGVKGVNLALMIDLFAAALTGANFSKDASPYSRSDGPPPGVGQLIVAFDPEAFAPGFGSRVEALVASMLAQAGVRLPGDRRLARRQAADRNGVEVPDELWASIVKEAAQ